MNTLSNIEKQKAKQIFDAETFKVSNVYGNNIIDEKDQIIVLPYLKELNNILLKYQSIPAYETKQPEIDKYAQALTCKVNSEYTINENIKRACINDFGIKIDDNFQLDVLSPIFLYPNSNVRFYICILPLMEYDYEQVLPEEDKKQLMKSKNISVNINELNNVIFYELISRYVIDLFKQHYSLF